MARSRRRLSVRAVKDRRECRHAGTSGGKGANLAEITNLARQCRAGFTIGTNVCTDCYVDDQLVSAELEKWSIRPWRVEKEMGAKFGSTIKPLLFSCVVCSRSMPGMMDTVLNIGLNDKTVEALTKQSGNERSAWDSYRRFVQRMATSFWT